MARRIDGERRRVDSLLIHASKADTDNQPLGEARASAFHLLQSARPFAELLALLTPEEFHVLEKFVELHCDKKIARVLGKKSHTVRNQLLSMQRKLGVRSRLELPQTVLVAQFHEYLRMGQMTMDLSTGPRNILGKQSE